MTITSTRAPAPFMPLNTEAEPYLLRSRRAAVLESVPAGLPRPAAAGPRADGDSELAGLVAKALLQVSGDHSHDAAIMVENIPPNSTFGQWWSQLGRAMESPHVRDWLRTNGINTESVMIAPTSGRISYQLIPTAPGQTNGLDDKGWAQVGANVRAAASVVGDGSPDRFKPPLSQSSNSAPLWLVSQFYKEPEHILPAHAHERAAELERDKAFPELDRTRFEDVHETRSADELERQKALVGNTQTLNTVGLELNYLLERIQSGSVGSADILDYLHKNTFELHLDSSYRQPGTAPWNTISLKEFLEVNGWDVPSTPEGVENLRDYLLRPELQAPRHGNYGGALEWQPPLARDTLIQLRASLRHGKVGDVDLSRFKNVLEYLMQGRSFEPSELRHPSRLLDSLIQSPKGKALGEALQAKFDAKSIKGTATEWLLAAMSVDHDSSFRATDPRSRHFVAGFAVTGTNTWGKPASTVVSGLAKHLVDTGKASSPEKASIQAHLLLCTRAPEFLVKDIPPQVTPGSHSWVSFVTAVERVEAQSPGSVAGLSYGQVMLQAEVAPVCAQERYVEYAAQQEALKDWGYANGMPFALTDVQTNDVRNAFNAQINELKAASDAQSTPMPTRKELALEQLKQKLPHMTQAQLEEKCITLKASNKDFPGPYSVLDLYMDERAYVEKRLEGVPGNPPSAFQWTSTSSAVDIDDILEKTKDLPFIGSVFQDAFSAYATGLEKSIGTQVKSMISRLPLQDRNNFEYGKITLVKEVDVARSTAAETPRERVKPNTLLVQTERTVAGRGETVHTYEIDLKKGLIVERPDVRHLQPESSFVSRPLADNSQTRRDFDEVQPKGDYSAGLSDEKPNSYATPNSFNSERTSYIADALVQDADIQSLRNEAHGVTTFATEVPFYKKTKEFLLNLIPLRSAIVNFQNGELGAGVRDLVMDVFGFVAGIGTAARAGKALQAGASAFSTFVHASKIVGRAALGSLNPISGLDDIAKGALKLGRKTLTAGRNGIHHVRGALRSVDLTSLVKKPGIGEGVIKAANTADEVKVVAKFDDATGNWHALNLKTKQPYGAPLENFTPNKVPMETLHSNTDLLHKKFGAPSQICYEKSLLVGQAENALPLKTRQTVLGSLDKTASSNYTPRYKEFMGITPGNTGNVFDPSDITESGIINFMDKNRDGVIVHTAYVQKTSDGKLFLYNTNQLTLDGAMVKATGKIDPSAGALVHSLDNSGLQSWLDTGYAFAFTPNSALNANVKRLVA